MAHLETLKIPRFENCVACYPSPNTPIFLCTKRKAEWYLEKGLAESISEDPLKILLKFQPKGNGHKGRNFFLQSQVNICVVCGTTENLTKHHIVPFSYSKHFTKGREFVGHDIVLLCENCHLKAEEFMPKVRERVAKKYGIPLNKASNIKKSHWQAYSLINALQKHGDVIPEERKLEIKQTLYMLLSITQFDSAYLDKIAEQLMTRLNQKDETHSKKVVDKLESVDEFAIMWRNFFMQKMKPKYMPEHWKVGARFYD